MARNPYEARNPATHLCACVPKTQMLYRPCMHESGQRTGVLQAIAQL